MRDILCALSQPGEIPQGFIVRIGLDCHVALDIEAGAAKNIH
jgi:hypothetical protein